MNRVLKAARNLSVPTRKEEETMGKTAEFLLKR